MSSLIGTYAPEFPQGIQWLNSPPLKMKDLRGKLVLVDFWTYSCINCLRTLPYIKRWHELYSPLGLVIIGVHTPEFDFEKNPANVDWSAKNLDLKYPIALDSDYKIWNLYANAFWPRKLLINPEGKIIYDHIGEGAYSQTEKTIQEEIKKLNARAYLPSVTKDEGQGGVCYPTTPEYYLGAKRGHIGNALEWRSGEAILFNDAKSHRPDTVYLEGFWDIHDEYIQPVLNLKKGKNYLAINFKGVEVNLVAAPAREGTFRVQVLLNGKPLTYENRGIDVKLEKNESFIDVWDARMYKILNSREYFEGAELKFIPLSPEVRFYVFTFGGRPPTDKITKGE